MGTLEKGGRCDRITAIIITATNKLLEPIRDRIPVIIDPKDVEVWLNPEIGGGEIAGMLTPHAETIMKCTR